MTYSKKPWWCAPMLAVVLGCAGDATPPAAPLSPTPTNEIRPTTTPTTTKDNAPKTEPRAEIAPKPEPKADAAPKIEPPKNDEPPKVEGPKAEAKPSKLNDEEIAEIKKLPAAEQELALKQAVCPVSDGHLGAMGKPVKVTAEGKTFYLCCKSCEDDVKADPKAVVAKLAK